MKACEHRNWGVKRKVPEWQQQKHAGNSERALERKEGSKGGKKVYGRKGGKWRP